MPQGGDLVLRKALAVLIDAISTDQVQGFHHAEAVVVILGETQVSQGIVDFVAQRYLAIYVASTKEHHFFLNSSALSAAVRVVKLGTSQEVTKKVLRETAKRGWFVQAESMAEQSLGRGLTRQEVLWLIDAYLCDTATQADHVEEDLKRLAREYLPTNVHTRVIERLEKFREDFLGSD